MADKTKEANKFWQDYYGSLDGATIIKFNGFSYDDEDECMSDFPTFDVRLKDGSLLVIEVSQDEEGNGGGFIFGLPLPLAVGP